MIPAGKLSDRITIERRQDTKGPAGKITTTWSSVATVWAQPVDPILAEETDAAGVLASGRIVFRCRPLPVTPADRLKHNGETFNIVTVKTLGLRRALELTCEAVNG